ncbi:methyltransferase [Candidatus Woesearchaeota archaeon]|nr:methyltransferase [Candidatus Woesearchaeota archaeon]
MNYKQIKEGDIKLFVPVAKRIYDAPVFYNPHMVTNRDISILLLKALDRKFYCMDLLAGTGVRGLRIKKEIPKAQVDLNDKNPVAYKLIKKNASFNKLKVNVSKANAEFRLANYKQVYNYIDIDPFGTPVPFLDPAIKALKWKGGILGVTATDTSALCGTYVKACKRKYRAKPLRNYLMHELGIRILIKKIQEVAAQYDIALTPIFCHSTRHYMRVYLKADSGAKKADKILKQHCMYEGAGPFWTGDLWDTKLANKMYKLLSKTNVSQKTKKIIHTIKEESKIKTFGFFDIHKLAKEYKLKQVPRFDRVIAALHQKKYKAARTHFSDSGIRTNAPLKTIVKIIKS